MAPECTCRVATLRENVFLFSAVAEPDVLEAPNILEYPYARSIGPVIGRFMTGLRDRRILGIRATDGRVMCPPTEYDPDTGEELTDDDVRRGRARRARSRRGRGCTSPHEKHPLDRPFAWALIGLDGADTALLHAVDAGDESRMRTGMRVHAPLARGARRRHPRHRGLRARGRSSGRARTAAEPRREDRHADRAALPVHRRARPDAVPARHRAGEAPRPALPAVRQGVRAAPRRVRGVRRGDRRGGRGQRQGHGHHVLRRQRAVLRPEDGDPVRVGDDPARRRRHRAHAPHPGGQGRGRAHGHAGRGGVGAARGAHAEPREHQVLPAHRRARRRLRDLPGARRDARRGACVSFAQWSAGRGAGAQRGRDPHPRRRRGDRALGHRPQGDRLHRARARATTSPARRSRSSWASTRSARGRRSASRTSRWTAPGRCTRRGCASSTATSTPRSCTRSGSRASATCRSC